MTIGNVPAVTAQFVVLETTSQIREVQLRQQEGGLEAGPQPPQPPQPLQQERGLEAGSQPPQPPRHFDITDLSAFIMLDLRGPRTNIVPANPREYSLFILKSFFKIPEIYTSAAAIGKGALYILGSDSEKEPDIFSSTLPLAILVCGSVSLFLEVFFLILNNINNNDPFSKKIFKHMFEYGMVPLISNAVLQNGAGFKGLGIGLGVLSGCKVVQDSTINYFRR
jgi:hypothetical protein